MRQTQPLRQFACTLSIAVLASSTPAWAQSRADSTELLRLEGLWDRAHLGGHVDSLAMLWDDDLLVAVPGMALLNRETSLAVARTRRVVFREYATTVTHLRMAGDRAVTEGRLRRVRMRDGQELVDNWMFTKVYRRSTMGWKVQSFVAVDRAP